MERTIKCACDKIIAIFIGDPKLRTICHCRDCRKANGGDDFQDLMFCNINQIKIVVPRDQLIEVPASEYKDECPRYFCKDCNTFIYGDVSQKDGRPMALIGPMSVLTPTLPNMKPSLHMYIQDKVIPALPNDGLPRVESLSKSPYGKELMSKL